MDTRAVIFEEGCRLTLGDLALLDPGPQDVVVDVHWSGVSAGTERLLWSGDMPWFPGLKYPLVPGYEAVGEVVEAGAQSGVTAGQRVFVPGANCYRDASGLFGAAASRVVVPGQRVLPVGAGFGDEAVLLSLAATAHHALAAAALAGPTLIVGHGTLGRLLARIAVALGGSPPTVWECSDQRMGGAREYGYDVTQSDDDACQHYETIIDASGDHKMLDQMIARLERGGEIILAGFYAKPLSFAFPPAFMREARLRIAAEWQPSDLDSVVNLVEQGRLDLGGLISHWSSFQDAQAAYQTAFTEPSCTKMVLDWRSKQ